MPSEPRPALVAPENRVGSVLNGKWTLERLIGQGGMAVVYSAVHRNRKRAAVKILLPELSAHPEIRERFLREGYVANSVNHRGVVRVDDDDVSEDGAAYLVMELLEGQTVQERWERLGRRMPLAQALAIADELLSVLIVAHGVGVVHRDLKPDNLYLTRDGALKVLDFGIARLRELGKSSNATRTGAIMGTPAFMAPEQARGRWELVDSRTDLWAVGALLFTLITGRPVHQAETANETLALACIQRAASVRTLAPDTPAEIAQVIDSALAYEMGERPADAASMQQTLRTAAGELLGATALASALAVGSSASSPSTQNHPVVSTPTQLAAAVSHVTDSRKSQRGRWFWLWVVAALGLVVSTIVALTRHPLVSSDTLHTEVSQVHSASTLAAPPPQSVTVSTPPNEAVAASGEPSASMSASVAPEAAHNPSKPARRKASGAPAPAAARAPNKVPDPMSLRR